MLSTPGAIFFQTVLEFLPIEELKFGKHIAQKLYGVLAENEPYAYDNINVSPGKVVLSADRGGVSSACQIEPHRIVVEERKANFTVDEFVAIVQSVTDGLLKTECSCPPIIIQRTRIQCLSQPHGSGDSLQLLAGRVAVVLDRISPFNRSPSFFGVRFRFLPESVLKGDDEADEREASSDSANESFVTMRFETHASDRRLVFMEAAATNTVMPPAECSNPDVLKRNIVAAYEFLTKNGTGFLDQFDHEDPGDETGE